MYFDIKRTDVIVVFCVLQGFVFLSRVGATKLPQDLRKCEPTRTGRAYDGRRVFG
jgi:hypothetical protein